MKTLGISFFFLFFFITQTTSSTVCTPHTCGLPIGGPVRFPFRLANRQPPGCGYRGFNLLCNNSNQTTLNLPSGEVIVKQINYYYQSILIDPQFCVPNRIHNFSLVGTPFTMSFLRNYTFLNCSSHGKYLPADSGAVLTLYCLSGSNYTVYVLRSDYVSEVPGNCTIISTLEIPARWSGDISSVDEFELQWYMPECRFCESDGGTCGTKSKHPNDIVCFGTKSQGIQSRLRYGLMIGLGVPGLLFIIVILGFTNEMARTRGLGQITNVSFIPLTPLRQPTRVMGLDRSTIELYPKTVLEDLQNPNEDGTCPICLSDYQPKEELRTIPDCTHYFRVCCIDEWLSVNATCPVCRRNAHKATPP